MSLNSVEGWNQYVRESYSKVLRERGIEPTAGNLAAFQAEVEALVDKLEAEAKKRRGKEPLGGQRIEKGGPGKSKIFGHTQGGFPPHDPVEKG